MRRLSLSRSEVEAELESLERRLEKTFAAMSMFGKHPNPRDPEYRTVEEAHLSLLSRRRKLRESGVVPWERWLSLSSVFDDEFEVWAVRALAPTYKYVEGSDSGKTKKVWEPALVVVLTGTGLVQHIRLTKDQADDLRAQLEYELNSWDSAEHPENYEP